MFDFDDWYFCRKFDCRDSNARPRLIDRFQAGAWLRRFKTDVFKLLAMRELLLQAQIGADPRRMPDEAVIEQISELLIAGHLHIHLRPMRVTTGRPAEGEPSQPSFPISERQAPKATTPSLKVQTPPDPPTFPPNVNAAQQAEAHVEAAVNGTPFCAVCAALAAARAAAAEAASRG